MPAENAERLRELFGGGLGEVSNTQPEVTIGKGSGKHQEVEEEAGSVRSEEAKGEGKKGRSVGSSHAVFELSLSSASVSVSIKGKGKSQVQADIGGDIPQGSAGGGGNRLPIYITPFGTRCHNFPSCPSLWKTTNLVVSPYCQGCAGFQGNDQDPVIYCRGPGQLAHYRQDCPRGSGSRPFRRCGLCIDIERRG